MPDFVANGARLRYEIFGEKGPTIVFLNGIAMTIGHWKPVVEILGGKYRFLCYDMRGQTLSEKPAGKYSLENHANDLAELMASLSINKAHIVGTSFGAEVALAFAIAHPEKCETLTVIDGVSELDPLLRAAVESWMAAALCDPRVFYKTIQPWNYSPSYIGASRDKLEAREDAVAALPREWFTGFADLCLAFLDINLTASLKRVTCKTLVLVAELDILKGKKFASIIAASIKGARMTVLPEAGHAVVIEQPSSIAREIDFFISGGEA